MVSNVLVVLKMLFGLEIFVNANKDFIISQENAKIAQKVLIGMEDNASYVE
jgi:hypothetical protein